MITADIRYYTKLRNFERQESASNAAGSSLEETRTLIATEQASSDLLALLYQHRQRIHLRIFGFLASAATAFTHLIGNFKQQIDNFRTKAWGGAAKYHKDPLQDLMTQMITTIRLLRFLELVPDSFNGEFISDIFREVCRCVGLLEGVVGCSGGEPVSFSLSSFV